MKLESEVMESTHSSSKGRGFKISHGSFEFDFGWAPPLLFTWSMAYKNWHADFGIYHWKKHEEPFAKDEA